VFDHSDSSENSDNEHEDQSVVEAIQCEEDEDKILANVPVADTDESFFFFGKIWKTIMAYANGFQNIRGREISL
jgi:hypothetical protein